MDNYLIYIICLIAGLAIGFFIARALEKSNASKLVKNAKKEATAILKDAASEAETLKKR